MRKRQMKQERECEEDQLKNTSGLGLNPQTSPSASFSSAERWRKAEELTQPPLRDIAQSKEKELFCLEWSLQLSSQHHTSLAPTVYTQLGIPAPRGFQESMASDRQCWFQEGAKRVAWSRRPEPCKASLLWMFPCCSANDWQARKADAIGSLAALFWLIPVPGSQKNYCSIAGNSKRLETL